MTSSAIRDPARLAAVEAAKVVDAPPEEAFDRLTRIAASAVESAMAALSVLGAEHSALPAYVKTAVLT